MSLRIRNSWKYLGNIFQKEDGNIDRKKYQLYSKIKINLESDVIKNNYKKELSEYFKYNSDKNLFDIFKKLKFIRGENDYIYYYENDDNKKRPLDEELIKLYYQILGFLLI